MTNAQKKMARRLRDLGFILSAGCRIRRREFEEYGNIDLYCTSGLNYDSPGCPDPDGDCLKLEKNITEKELEILTECGYEVFFDDEDDDIC